MLHVGARYYDPQVGRFISRDAVLGEHPYLYCEHEPVNAVDPSGYIWGRLVIWVVGAIVLPWVEDRFNIPPEATWPIDQLIDEIGDDLMDEVRLPGFGSAFGAAKTIIDGMDTLAKGVRVVVGYRHRVEEYMDPDGRWDGVD